METATFTLPRIPAGYGIFTHTSQTVIPGTVDISIGDTLVASMPVTANGFRTYRVLVYTPPTITALASLQIHTHPVVTRENRELGIALTHLSFLPTTLYGIINVWYVIWLILTWALIGQFTYVHTLVRHIIVPIVLSIGLIVSAQWGLLTPYMGVGLALAVSLPILHRIWDWGVHYVRTYAKRTSALPPVADTAHHYRSEIDGLRAFAVTAVVLYHAFPDSIPGGFIGVDVFFVISGFLITNILLNQIQHGTFHIGDFYIRRIRRIFSALIVVLCGTALLGWIILFPSEFERLGWHIASGAGFVANITIFRELGYFAEEAIHTPLLHLWSLGIEEQFYFIWPVFLWWWARQPRYHWHILLGLIGISFCYGAIMVWINRDAAYFLLPSRFWQLAAGGVLVVWQRRPQYSPLPGIYALIGAIVLVATSMLYNESLPFPGLLALTPTLAAMIIIDTDSRAWTQRRIFSHPWLVFIGLISYPLYLWHWPLISFAYLLLDTQFTLYWRIGVVIVSVILAVLTYFFIETPIRFGRFKQVPATYLIGGMLLIGGVVSAGMITKFIVPRQPDAAPHTVSELPITDCTQVFPNTPINTAIENFCLQVTNTTTDAPEIIVVGDSHSGAIATGFTQSAPSHALRSYMLPGCLPGLNIERYGNQDRTSRNCTNPGNYAAVLANLQAESSARARVIVVVGRFSVVSVNALNPDITSRIFIQAAGPRQNLDDQARAEVLTQGLRAFVEPLSQLPNTRVIVMQQVPEFDFTPNNCLRLAHLIGSNALCHTDSALIKAHAQAGQSAVRSALAGLTNVQLYDAWSLFCTTTECSPLDTQQHLLYRDSHHLSDIGGKRVTDDLYQQFLAGK